MNIKVVEIRWKNSLLISMFLWIFCDEFLSTIFISTYLHLIYFFFNKKVLIFFERKYLFLLIKVSSEIMLFLNYLCVQCPPIITRGHQYGYVYNCVCLYLKQFSFGVRRKKQGTLMASAASSSSTLCPLQQQQNSLLPNYPSVSRVIRFRPRNQQLPFRIRASSTIALDPVYLLFMCQFSFYVCDISCLCLPANNILASS